MLPISSGCAMRPSGMTASSLASSAGSFIVEVLIGVATAPGPTPTTSMLWHASSTPAVRVNIRIPPFDRQYAVLPATGLLDHLLCGQLGAKKRTLQVDGENLVVLRFRSVEHRRASFDAGIVDH